MRIQNKISQESKESLRHALIERIGPWAFQSFSKSKWHLVSDDDIIEGALANAPADAKLMLMQLYSLSHIMKVWREKVLVQDEWKRGNNVWIADHIFKQKNPKKFVRLAYQDHLEHRELDFAKFR